MEQSKIDRISALARKSRTEEGLTPEEKADDVHYTLQQQR